MGQYIEKIVDISPISIYQYRYRSSTLDIGFSIYRYRGNDTPHILDLVITDSQLIHNIDRPTLAPLGKSDHVVLMIETNFFSVKPPIEQKLNYDKGDYAALRSYLDCDWDKHFDAVALDVDEMWIVEYI